MAKGKNTNTNKYSTTVIEIDDSRKEQMQQSFEYCERIMHKYNLSWVGEDGKPLAPFELFKLFDKICDIALSGEVQ